MFQINRNQYIFKQSTGEVLSVFYKQNSGIYYSTLNKENRWSLHTAVLKNTLPKFSACLDDEDVIHILCEDNNGIIHHAFFNNNDWQLESVLKSRNPVSYDKHLNVICSEGAVYFFYGLEYKGDCLLSFQVKKDNTVPISEPNVIDYIQKTSAPYKVLKDRNNNIYVFYTRIENLHTCMGHRKYSALEGQWSCFYPVKMSKDYEGENEVLSAAVDYTSNIHLCVQRTASHKYELVYSRTNWDYEDWEKEKVLATSPSAFYNSSLSIIENKIIVYWVRENRIFYCSSQDSGGTWSKPQEYVFDSNKPFYCISYSFNEIIRRSYVYLNELPGNYSGGYKLGFINDIIQSKGELEVMNTLETSITNTLKLTLKNLENLQQLVKEIDISVKDISNKIQDMEARQVQIEKDIKEFITKQNTSGREAHEMKNRIEEAKETKKIDASVMSGAGFINITPEYLRNMKKK